MPNVNALAASGTTFSNAFIPNPTCCPSRSTILTGLQSGHTGVWTNGGAIDGEPAGGESAFRKSGNESRTLAFYLSTQMGYRTALYGKYLNHYLPKRGAAGPRVVPGWTDFHAFVGGNGKYYDYDLTDGTLNPDGTNHTVHFGSAPSDYSTNVLASQAVSFLQAQPDDEPFLLFFTPYGPHGPCTPGPGDGAVTAPTSFMSPAFDEADAWTSRPISGRALGSRSRRRSCRNPTTTSTGPWPRSIVPWEVSKRLCRRSSSRTQSSST